jgi:hypothetical protein
MILTKHGILAKKKRNTPEIPYCLLWQDIPYQDHYEVKQQYEAAETVS